MKAVYKKRTDEAEYRIVFYPGDRKYVVHRWDLRLAAGILSEIPKIGVFDNKEEAMQCIKNDICNV